LTRVIRDEKRKKNREREEKEKERERRKGLIGLMDNLKS
jgi:hypothetical protein